MTEALIALVGVMVGTAFLAGYMVGKASPRRVIPPWYRQYNG